MAEVRRRSPHVILVGLPGAGKSVVGQRSASRLGRPFVDFDAEIERRAGMPIAGIFRDRGEAGFRYLELELTRELAAGGGAILSPGGGWIAVPGALELLRPPARMIYLRASPDVALLRMGPGRAGRPLLTTAEPLATLQRLLEAREPLYRLADDVVDVNLIAVEEVTDIVVRLAADLRGE